MYSGRSNSTGALSSDRTKPGVYIDGMWEHSWPSGWQEGDPVSDYFWSTQMCREVLYEVEDGTVSFLTVFKDTWTWEEFMRMVHSIKPFKNDDE